MYKVGNYEFETQAQADVAQKELEGVRYIRSQTNMDDPDVVLQLYNSLILKEVFVTPVGFDFLRQLQEYLNTIPYIKNEDILLDKFRSIYRNWENIFILNIRNGIYIFL